MQFPHEGVVFSFHKGLFRLYVNCLSYFELACSLFSTNSILPPIIRYYRPSIFTLMHACEKGVTVNCEVFMCALL